ncbi:DUF4123 domain-containing protein [Ralstonia pseudosolanacearum]|uniref:DUF4123 domain-containing protein n=1 Tax=Ralstonia pseudosolanacearum TaxID=1310165 RepID=UPI0020A26D68
MLVRHLQSLMLPSEPRVGRRYLRLADRRVFEWIWPVLSPAASAMAGADQPMVGAEPAQRAGLARNDGGRAGGAASRP